MPNIDLNIRLNISRYAAASIMLQIVRTIQLSDGFNPSTSQKIIENHYSLMMGRPNKVDQYSHSLAISGKGSGVNLKRDPTSPDYDFWYKSIGPNNDSETIIYMVRDINGKYFLTNHIIEADADPRIYNDVNHYRFGYHLMENLGFAAIDEVMIAFAQTILHYHLGSKSMFEGITWAEMALYNKYIQRQIRWMEQEFGDDSYGRFTVFDDNAIWLSNEVIVGRIYNQTHLSSSFESIDHKSSLDNWAPQWSPSLDSKRSEPATKMIDFLRSLKDFDVPNTTTSTDIDDVDNKDNNGGSDDKA